MRRSISLCATILLLSCGEKASTGTNPSNTSSTSDAPAANAAMGGKGQCLLSFQHKFDELLPLAIAAEASKLAADKAQTQYNNNKKPLRTDKKAGFDIGTNELLYLWPSDRMEEIPIGPAKGQKIPADNKIGLRSMSVMNKEFFTKSYKPMTDQEIEDLKKQAADELAKKGDANAPAANILADTIGGVTKAYKEVPNVAELARWNTIEKSLYVFFDGVKFEILVSVSDDNDTNQNLAVSLLPKIMEKCP
jgi:hypothetical protein